MAQQTIYVLDSRSKLSGTNQNATYDMTSASSIEIGTYELVNYHSVNHVYNVEAGVNNQIHFDEGGAELGPVLLAPGYYDTTTLAAEIKLRMDVPSGGSYGVVYDAVTGKYTITLTGGPGTFAFNWATVSTSKANALLGFSETDGVLAVSQVSDNQVDLTLHSSLIVDIAEDSQQNVTLLDGTEYSLIIPLDQAYQAEIDSLRNQTYSQTIRFAATFNQLNVQVFTEDGVALLNNPDYLLTIRKLF